MYLLLNNFAVSSQVGMTKWGKWSSCSVTCGQGTKVRRRICNNSKSLEESKCQGVDKETKSCELLPCPQIYKLSSWTPWLKIETGKDKTILEKRFRVKCTAQVESPEQIKISTESQDRHCSSNVKC